MQPNSLNSLGDPSLKSHRSQYTEHHPTEPAAYSDNTYREVECNEPEDISETRGVRTSRQEIESSDEREIEEDEDLEEGDDARNEEEEDDDVNSDIEDEHLEEENHNKTSLPDVEEDEEEDAEDAENDDESDHKEDNQQPLEHEYQSFGNPENSNKPTQPPATPEEKIDETKNKSKYTRPSHSGSPNRSRVHNYSMNTSQMNYTGIPNYLRDFSPSKVTVEEFEEYYEIFCINFLKRREEELDKKRRAQAELELSELQDRPNINANPNRHHIPLLERTPLLNARREKEIERMRKEKEAKLAKELEELTFKPNINERSRGLASSSPNKSYYNSSSTYQGTNKRSPKKARKVGTFKPKINQTSRAIAKGVKERTSDDLVDRLYYQSNVIQTKKEELLKQLTPRFTPFLNKNTEKIHKKKNKDDASSFQGQKYEISDQDQQEYSDTEEHPHGHGGRSARSTKRFETESAYQTPRKPQQHDLEQANNEELLAILKQFNNMLKKKNENPINIQQLGTLMAGYADKRKSQREQAAQRDQEISTIEKNLKQVHGSLKNLREQSSENPSKVSLKEVRFDNDDEEDGKSYSTTGKMIKATYKTMEPTKKSPKKLKKFQTEKTETHDSEAPLSAKDISSYSSQAANHSSLSKGGALNKDNSRSSTPNLKSNSNLDNTTEKSMSKKKKKGDNESPKKKKKKASVSQDPENENITESPEKKKKKKKARSKDRGMNTEEIAVLEKGTQTSKKSKNNGQSNSDFSSQVVGSKNAIEGWYQSNQNDKDDDIIFVSNEGHRTDEERVMTQTNQPNETSFGSQSREDQDVNVNNFRGNHSQRVKYESEKSKGSSNNLGKSQGENHYSSKGRSQNPETSSKQGLSDKSYQSDNNRSKSKQGEKNRSQNHFTASEDEVAVAQDVEAGEYEEFEQEERPKASHNNKKRSQAGSSSKKEKSRESREYKEDMSREQDQSQQQLGRNRAQTNEVKPQTQPSAQELSRRRGYSDPKAEKSPSNRTPSKNHQSKKPSGFRESSVDKNQKNNNTHNTHNTADKFRSISSISGDVQSDDPEKILSFNDEKGFTKSIDSSSNSHDDSETDKEEKEEGSGQIRNRVESISFSANNKAFNYRSNQSDQQQVPQSAQSKHENDSVKSKNSNERLSPEERRQGRNQNRHAKNEVFSTETIQIQPNSTKRSSYGYAMDRNDRTLNSASSRGLKAIAQHIVKKFKAYDEQIKKSAKEYTISVSPPRSGSRSQSHSHSPDGSHNQTPEMKVKEPLVGEKKLFKTAHKAQLDSVEKSSKKHRQSLQGDSGSGKKVESVKRYTVGAR